MLSSIPVSCPNAAFPQSPQSPKKIPPLWKENPLAVVGNVETFQSWFIQGRGRMDAGFLLRRLFFSFRWNKLFQR